MVCCGGGDLIEGCLAGGSEREEKQRKPGDSHHHLEILGQAPLLTQTLWDTEEDVRL